MGWVKRSLTLWISILFCSGLIAANPEKVSVALQATYVPIGFDDNDNSQAVVTGVFPDSCFKMGPTDVQADHDKKIISVTQYAYRYSGICLKVKVPFSQVVDLGILREGSYQLVDGIAKVKIGSIPVTRAKVSTPDDFLYAPVTQAELKMDGTTPVLSLHGQFTTRCMRLKGEPVVNYYEKVVVVLPIAEWLGGHDGGGCDEVNTRFGKEIRLQPITGSTLIHIRSMNGQSINQLFDFSGVDRP